MSKKLMGGGEQERERGVNSHHRIVISGIPMLQHRANKSTSVPLPLPIINGSDKIARISEKG